VACDDSSDCQRGKASDMAAVTELEPQSSGHDCMPVQGIYLSGVTHLLKLEKLTRLASKHMAAGEIIIHLKANPVSLTVKIVLAREQHGIN
jgi:hypothetical protein